MKMNPKFKKSMGKWLLCCGTVLGMFLLLGEIGLLFAVGGCFCIIKFL